MSILILLGDISGVLPNTSIRFSTQPWEASLSVRPVPGLPFVETLGSKTRTSETLAGFLRLLTLSKRLIIKQ